MGGVGNDVTMELSTSALAQRCAEESKKFARRESNDPQFCLALLRRALVDRAPDAFTHVYQIYNRQVTHWVYQHSRFALTGESAEYFSSAAFQSFYTALQGSKFEQFSSLPAVLTYLKLCVHTAIARYLRDDVHTPTVSLDDRIELAEEPDLSASVDVSELWSHICQLLPDERDQLLARCAFVLGLKPRQIAPLYRSFWSSERDISVALYRIRGILRSDAELVALAGGTALP